MVATLAILMLIEFSGQQPAAACAVWSTSENRCLQAATVIGDCAVWSSAENRCLDAPKPRPSAPPGPVSSAVRADPARQAAIAALRAVKSVLDGGANAAEFKKYYLEAKVKVDALPQIPENEILADVSGTYGDVATLSIAAIVHEFSAYEVSNLKAKYAGTYVANLVNNIPDAGVSRTSTAISQERATIWLRGSAQGLLAFASQKLAAVEK